MNMELGSTSKMGHGLYAQLNDHPCAEMTSHTDGNDSQINFDCSTSHCSPAGNICSIELFQPLIAGFIYTQFETHYAFIDGDSLYTPPIDSHV